MAATINAKGFKYLGMVKHYKLCKNWPVIVAFVAAKVTVVALFSSLFLPTQALASIAVRNVSPLSQGTGLAPLFSGQLLNEKQQHIGLSVFGNSHFIVGDKSGKELFFDAETWQGDIDYAIGFKNLELRVNLPWLSYSGGKLDGLVDGFHELFSLPEGNRGDFKRNQVFLGFNNGADKAFLAQSQKGFGDLRISAGFNIANNAQNQHALWLHAKLPTGKQSPWFSSGGVDAGVYMVHQFEQGLWQQQLQYGALYASNGDYLSDYRRNIIGQLQANLSVQASKQWQLIAQVDANTAIYKNVQQKTMGTSVLLSLGGNFSYKGQRYSLAITEDLLPESAPDVGFLFRFSQTFN